MRERHKKVTLFRDKGADVSLSTSFDMDGSKYAGYRGAYDSCNCKTGVSCKKYFYTRDTRVQYFIS